jgi:hypothetical protein
MAQTKTRTGTRKRAGTRTSRTGTKRRYENDRYLRDHIVILAIPKPFAKTRRKLRRFRRRVKVWAAVLFWLAITAALVYMAARGGGHG